MTDAPCVITFTDSDRAATFEIHRRKAADISLPGRRDETPWRSHFIRRLTDARLRKTGRVLSRQMIQSRYKTGRGRVAVVRLKGSHDPCGMRRYDGERQNGALSLAFGRGRDRWHSCDLHRSQVRSRQFDVGLSRSETCRFSAVVRSG